MIEKAQDLPPAEDGDAASEGLPAPAGEGAEAGVVSGRARGRAGRSRGAARGASRGMSLGAPDAAPLPEGDQLGEAIQPADLADELSGAGVSDAAADAAQDEPVDAAADAAASAQLPLGARIEALLFASAQPLSPMRLANVLEVDVAGVNAALEGLVAAWAQRPGAVDLVEIAGGYRFLTRPEYHADVGNLRGKVGTERLSPAALETLAVVAYRQPLGRAEVEAVRGVQVGPVLRLLLDRDLIRVTGRSAEPGHPQLYGTTRRFLDHFGLKSLKALPDLKDLLESP